MNKKNINYKVEYLSLILVLSFFIFHNIYLVFFGISLAIYMINKDFINNLLIFNIFKVNNEDKVSTVDINKKENTIYNSKKEDNLISLVEEIEESGFIPSINKNDTNKAA